MLVGWGAFNVSDSVVNHWLLNLHNIRPGPDALVYDAAFFALGLGLMVLGRSAMWRARATGT
jgi:uncharacterized membrane protein